MKARKHYINGMVCVTIEEGEHFDGISFDDEKQMRRAGQCLVDLARIGGNEVEIKDKE
jgi:hypothetical protein